MLSINEDNINFKMTLYNTLSTIPTPEAQARVLLGVPLLLVIKLVLFVSQNVCLSLALVHNI